MSVKIPLKKYVMDESLSWEARYAKLDAHHLEETQWLIAELERTTQALEQARLDVIEREWAAGNVNRLEYDGRRLEWLANTASPAMWWPRLPDDLRERARQWIAGRDTLESPDETRAMLDRLAKELGALVLD